MIAGDWLVKLGWGYNSHGGRMMDKFDYNLLLALLCGFGGISAALLLALGYAMGYYAGRKKGK